MAFARMNNFSFWLMIPAAVMLAGSFFMPGGAPAAGWTLYAPLTLQMGPSMDAGIFALHVTKLLARPSAPSKRLTVLLWCLTLTKPNKS